MLVRGGEGELGRKGEEGRVLRFEMGGEDLNLRDEANCFLLAMNERGQKGEERAFFAIQMGICHELRHLDRVDHTPDFQQIGLI